jgi:hypothetical protein
MSLHLFLHLELWGRTVAEFQNVGMNSHPHGHAIIMISQIIFFKFHGCCRLKHCGYPILVRIWSIQMVVPANCWEVFCLSQDWNGQILIVLLATQLKARRIDWYHFWPMIFFVGQLPLTNVCQKKWARRSHVVIFFLKTLMHLKVVSSEN